VGIGRQLAHCLLTHCVAIAIKDWIYIDGGELSSTKGVVEPCKYRDLLANYGKCLMNRGPANTTIAIDLSNDWTNSSLTFVTTTRPAASLAENYQTLWWSKRDNSIYCFGGERSFAADVVGRVTPLKTPSGSLCPTIKEAGNGKQLSVPPAICLFLPI